MSRIFNYNFNFLIWKSFCLFSLWKKCWEKKMSEMWDLYSVFKHLEDLLCVFNILKENFDVAALSRHSQESEHWHHHFTQLWKTRAPCSVTCHNGTRNGTQFWLTGNEPLAFFLNQLFLMIFSLLFLAWPWKQQGLRTRGRRWQLHHVCPCHLRR